MGETPGADFARVRPLSRMDAHMNRELGSLVETGAALGARERFVVLVLGVSPHVISNMSFETLAADVALVQALVLVERQDVSLERVASRIRFIAEVTLKFASPLV